MTPAPCARISRNFDQDASGQPTGGSVLRADEGWLFIGRAFQADPTPGPRGTLIEGNRGGRLADVSGDGHFHGGSVLVADNVVRQGRVADETDDDANVRGVRQFNAALAADPRLTATIMQTVSSKGYDGIAIAVVNERG